MTVSVPTQPATVTVVELRGAFPDVKTDERAAELLELATQHLNLQLQEAFRDVSQELYDDWLRQVFGALVGRKRRPVTAAGSGQLTTVGSQLPVDDGARLRDPLQPIRAQLALYVAPGIG